ncbi:MAG TPA: glycosyltransferase family 39 protein, partial [Vicinamibacteria bacterium]|nr:glycosyltransferase family 39 protein [Vicinamibacteria bacterium]
MLVAALSLLARLLYLADVVPDLHTPAQPGVRMAARYSEAAVALLEGDGILYPRRWPDPSDTGLVSRPPGYPAFVAMVEGVAGPSYVAVLSAQALLSVLAPVLLLLLASRAAGHRAGLAAGLVAAVSPPLGYHAVVFTPDALAALLAVAIVTVLCGGRRRPAAAAVAAGALAGIATWLRPNFLLLPVLLLLTLWLAWPARRSAWRAALVVAVAWAIVAPITIRNDRLYGELVPVSSNFGIVLWEGIADLGGERFGAHPADREVAREEAARLGDPRYAGWWASPDGIRRDRDRVRRSLEVIGTHPRWFVAGCLRRAVGVVDQQAAAPLVSASLP